jgi:hypothetical protein
MRGRQILLGAGKFCGLVFSSESALFFERWRLGGASVGGAKNFLRIVKICKLFFRASSLTP